MFYPYANGTPSNDTFRRIFTVIDVNHFQKLFTQWALSLKGMPVGKTIAIDGKTSRRSHIKGKNPLHAISAYVTETRLVLGQVKVDTKSNEITAVPVLLDLFDIKGATITGDALICQHEIGRTIRKKEGHFIFALKKNHANLFDDVKTYLEDANNVASPLLDQHKTVDAGHERIETRICSVSHDVEWLHKRNENWTDVRTIISIQATRTINEKTTHETRFYIASDLINAQSSLTKIRSHWTIENSLHWILDMSFGDDQSRIRKGNAPLAILTIKKMALNLLQHQKTKHPQLSIKVMRKKCGWSNDFLYDALTQNFS